MIMDVKMAKKKADRILKKANLSIIEMFISPNYIMAVFDMDDDDGYIIFDKNNGKFVNELYLDIDETFEKVDRDEWC